MSHMRKAVAAFVLGLLSMPIAEWVSGDQPFSRDAVVKGVFMAVVSGVTVYMTPNAEKVSPGDV